MRRTFGILALAIGAGGILVSLPAPWATAGAYCDCVLKNGFGSPVLALLLTLTTAVLLTSAVTAGRRPFNSGGALLVPTWCAALWVIGLWSTGFGDASIDMRERWGFSVLTIALTLGAGGYVLVAFDPNRTTESDREWDRRGRDGTPK